MTSTNEEAATTLNDYFTSVFNVESSGPLPEFPDLVGTDGVLSHLVISKIDVQSKLLFPGKSPGPDSIYPRILKYCAHAFALPLTFLLNKSLEEGTIPKAWKDADVVPIHKKGLKTNPGNYRPISLTSIFSKILEKFIKEEISHHMTNNELLNNAQYGFWSKRFCVLQLLEAMKEWTKSLDDGLQVDVIYLEFKKVFDSAPHNRLLKKLSAYGIREQILVWLDDFLKGRRRRVQIGCSNSDWSDTLSGVPQGSVLGPMLFLIYINDLPDTLFSCIKLFADDTKLFRVVSTQQNRQALQNDLQRNMDWSEEWELAFNSDKCSEQQFR